MTGTVPSGDKSPEAGLEGWGGQIGDHLQMHCLVGEADKHTDVCLDLYWSSGVSHLEGERSSKVQACVGEWSCWVDSGRWQFSHHLWLRFRGSSSAGDALGAG